MILAIVGPTGVGKTKLSVELAKKYNAIVINCDSMQVYEELNIGTAKIKESEKEGVSHFLFDIRKPDEQYSVFDYQKDARNLLRKYQDSNIIFVGGTGLYLKAVLFDYRFHETEITLNTYDDKSNEELFQMALIKDANMEIHQNNRQRLVRFLNKETENSIIPVPLYEFKIIGLTTDRENLYQRINQRVDTMFENGLLEEANQLYEKYENSPALQTAIGYKEFQDYFKQNKTLTELKEEIKKNSRHYAKRQYTWFNNQFEDIKWLNVDFENFKNTIDEAIQIIEKDCN